MEVHPYITKFQDIDPTETFTKERGISIWGEPRCKKVPFLYPHPNPQ
jgi:hypothetical protein